MEGEETAAMPLRGVNADGVLVKADADEARRAKMVDVKSFILRRGD